MKRSLGLFDVTCLGVNAIIGSGIFALPDDLYREMGGLSPLAFLLCAVGLTPIALCYAEAASMTERSGGPYVYAGEAFGAETGFVVGWMCFVNSLFSFAAVAAIAAAYLGKFVPGIEGVDGEATTRAVAAGIIAAFAALNYFGAKPGARVTDAFTLAKVAVLVLLVVAALPAVEPSRLAAPLPHGAVGIGAGTFLALFAAQGFEVAPVPAGETCETRRNMPIAIIASLLLSSAIYVVVQIVVVGAHAGLGAATDTPLVDAALRVAPALGAVVLAGGLISTLGFVSGNALGTPRYAFAAAQDGYLPRWLAAVSPRFDSPTRAIVVTAALAGVMTLAFDYRRLVGMSNVTVAVQYLATCLAVLVLRRFRPDAKRSFRAPGGALVPLSGAAVSVWIFTEGSPTEILFAVGALAIGVAIATISRRAAKA